MLTTVMGIAVVLTGCSSSGGGYSAADMERTKTIAGAVIGGVVGHQFGKGRGRKVATIAGAVLGGYLAGAMSPYGRQQTNSALNNNTTSTWTEPGTNNNYTVTPTNTYTSTVNGHQSTCRNYTMDAYIDGKMQQVKGRACKDTNGQWVSQS